MNYISLINNFWLLSEEYEFRPIDIALYFYLLKIANSLSWKPSFKRNNVEIMTKLGINSRHTFNDTRNRLKMAGLIDYKTYNGKPISTYSIIDSCAKNAQVTAQVTAQVGAQVGAQLNKTKTKTNIKKENIKKEKNEVRELELDLTTEKPQKKGSTPSPTLEEVVSVCRSKGMTDEEAENFFYYYDAQGWVTTGGQKIKRIDSMVNRWLTNRKEKKNGTDNSTDSAKREARNKALFDEIMSHYG